MEAKISIIMPVYNMAHVLPRMFESILLQNFQDFEVICVNDVSTDESQEVLYAWKSKDPRFKYIINEQNIGECPSRNVGLRAACGKYFLNADPDDEYPPNAFQCLYDIAEQHNSDMVRGGFLLRRPGLKDMIQYLVPKGIQKYVDTNFDKCQILHKIPGGHWASLYRAELFKNLLYPIDVVLGCDMLFNTNAYINAKKISIIKDVVYIYNYNHKAEKLINPPMRRIKMDFIWRLFVFNFLCDYNYNYYNIGVEFFSSRSKNIFNTYLKTILRFQFTEITELLSLIKEQYEKIHIPHYNSYSSNNEKLFFENVYQGKFKSAVDIIKELYSG